MSDFATALATIIATGFKIYEQRINDPKLRLQTREESKHGMKQKVIELIKQDKSGVITGEEIQKQDEMLVDCLTAIEHL